MKKKKSLLLLTLLFATASVMLSGCAKEEEINLEGRLLLKAEKITNKTKVAIDGATAAWVAGDEVRINNSTKVVAVDGSNATISDDGLAAPYHAIYPASLAADKDLTGSTVTVELPNQYIFQENGSHVQLLTLPMAASVTSGSSLEFKHLTAALIVRVTNSFGSDMQLQEILLQSDLSQISGTRTVDFSNVTDQTANDAGVTAQQKQVRMLFSTPLTISSGNSRDIMIPVCPVSESNKFTVTIVTTNSGNCYTFKHTQQGGANNTDRSLARNQMGYIPVTMSSGGEHITSNSLITTASEYHTMVTEINSAAAYSTHEYFISGTVDFSNNYIDTIVIPSNVTVSITGVNNAKLQNAKVRVAEQFYGLIKTNSNSVLNATNLTIENIDLSQETNSASCYIGGIIGSAAGTISLNNCFVRNINLPCTLSSNTTYYTGGLIGRTNTDCNLSISNCGFEQELTISPTIRNKTKSLDFGGIIGHSESTSINISNCQVKINEININPPTSFASSIAGIVGSVNNTSLNINNCTVCNYTSNGAFEITISLPTGCSASHCLGGIIGTASTPSSSHTISNNHIKVSLSEYKTNNQGTYIGCIIGDANYNDTPSTSGTLLGCGNDITGSSITLTGTGTGINTYFGYGTDFIYILGHYPVAQNIPSSVSSFVTGTPTFSSSRPSSKQQR